MHYQHEYYYIGGGSGCGTSIRVIAAIVAEQMIMVAVTATPVKGWFSPWNPTPVKPPGVIVFYLSSLDKVKVSLNYSTTLADTYLVLGNKGARYRFGAPSCVSSLEANLNYNTIVATHLALLSLVPRPRPKGLGHRPALGGPRAIRR